MKRFFTAALLLTASFTTEVIAKDEELLKAIQKLKDAGSYTWRSELNLTPGLTAPAIIEGKYNATQGVYVKVTSGKYSAELAMRGKSIVAKTDQEWKPVKKFTRSDIDHSMVRALRDIAPPHLELPAVQDTWRSSRKNTPTLFEGQMNLGTARKMVSSAIQQSGAIQLGSLNCDICKAAITLSNGLPERMILEAQLSGGSGFLSRGTNARLSQMTQLTDVGSTSIQLPPEAEAALVAEMLK